MPLGSETSPPNPALFGDWLLAYASTGTYVTRTRVAQALLAASRVPGLGLGLVAQGLSRTPEQGIATTNLIRFSLGPLGCWEATIYGTWSVQDGCTALVAFDAFSVRLVGLLGLRLPGMAQVSRRTAS